ncbi:MAG TPA: hypothetical protein VG405_00660 [Solirubrobacteraceae bacterium]|nr:hypothetical protein [Solirubrobacteraceae bacterium]
MGPRGALLSEARGAAGGLVEAYARMGAAIGSDFTGVIARRPTADPFEARDPAYIESTLPAGELMSRVYFRADVRGLEHIPPEGPILLVGNHSGGILIADTFLFAHAFYSHFGAPAPVLPTGPRPRVQDAWVTGTPPALRDGTGVSAEHGASTGARCRPARVPRGRRRDVRPSWESSTIDLAGRTGFIQLALKHNVPIAPVVAIGGQETGLFLGRGRAAARALGLGRFRLKVLPTVVGPPLGLTIWIYP